MALIAAALMGAGTSKWGWPIERLIGSLTFAARSKTRRMPLASMERARSLIRRSKSSMAVDPRAVADVPRSNRPCPPGHGARCLESYSRGQPRGRELFLGGPALGGGSGLGGRGGALCGSGGGGGGCGGTTGGGRGAGGCGLAFLLAGLLAGGDLA